VKEDRIIPGPLQLAGLEDKFFADVFLPEAPDQVSLRLRGRMVPARLD